MTPLFAGAIDYSFKQLSHEGYITMSMLAIVSLVSWSVIISKSVQLLRARRMSKKFFEAWRQTKNPLELARSGQQFEGSPAYEIYTAVAQEVAYHLEHNPVVPKSTSKSKEAKEGESDIKISFASFDLVKSTLERTAGAEALELERGMIMLSTAVAGGPFIGLLGTVFGVMETFAGIAIKQAASIAAMAPGVAGALLNTVFGLAVAIPAMFAYNFQVTTIRGITQELDNFGSELVTAFEHTYVDNRPLSEEIRDAISELNPMA